MSDEDWSKNEEWFNKDVLAGRLPKFEAIIADFRAEGRKDITPIEATRDFLAGRLAVLEGNLPDAEQKFGTSIDAPCNPRAGSTQHSASLRKQLPVRSWYGGA